MADPDSESYLCFLLHHLPRVRDGFIWAILEKNKQTGRGLKQFFSLPADAYPSEYRLPPLAAQALGDRGWRKKADEQWALCEKRGVRVMSVFDREYPANLRAYSHRPPPVLYLYGNSALLDTRKVAILNSRASGNRALEETSRFADAAADAGVTLLSSPSRVPYNVVALKAKVYGAPQIVVADRGLFQIFGKNWTRDPVPLARRLDAALDLQNTLVISPFSLDDVGTRGSGVLRDRFVVALADLVLGLSIRPNGNLHKELESALKKGKRVLAVSGRPEEAAGGNAALVGSGAEPLSPDETLAGWCRALDAPPAGPAGAKPSAPSAESADLLIRKLTAVAPKGFLRAARIVDPNCGDGGLLEAACRAGCTPERACGLRPAQDSRDGPPPRSATLYVADALLDQPGLEIEAGGFDAVVSDLTPLDNGPLRWLQDIGDSGEMRETLRASKHAGRFPAAVSGFRRQAAICVADALREEYSVWKLKSFDAPEVAEEQAALYLPGVPAPEPRPTKQLYDREFERLQRMDWNTFQSLPEGSQSFLRRLGRVPAVFFYIERVVQLTRPGGYAALRYCDPGGGRTELETWLGARGDVLSHETAGGCRLLLFRKR